MSSEFLYALILLFGVFVASVSQVMLKKATIKYKGSFVKEYLNPLVIGAYFLFFITTLLSVYAYKGIPLSMGPILEATSYVYVTFFGVKLFREKFDYKKLMALIIIILGIIIYSIFG